MDESGLIGIKQLSVGTGTQFTIAAPKDGAVRVFDLIMDSTANIMTFYAGTSSANGLIVRLDADRRDISTYGLRFISGLYGISSLTGNNIGIVTYHLEF